MGLSHTVVEPTFEFGDSRGARIAFPDGYVIVTKSIPVEMYEDKFFRPELLKFVRELRSALERETA